MSTASSSAEKARRPSDSLARMGERTSYTAGTFCWVELSTSDPDAAKAFYTRILGWEFEDVPIGDGMVYSMARLEGKDVAALQPLRGEGVPPNWLNYVAVDDVDGVAARAAELGATLVAPPFDVMDSGRMALVADPQGGMLGLWQAGRHLGAALVNAPGALTWNDLLTSDVEAARELYGPLFGWEFDDVAGGRYVTIRTAQGSNGGLMPTPMEGMPTLWQPYFAVTHLEETLGRVQELGGRLLTEPMAVPSGRFVAVTDPQGAMFSLIEGELDP
jgi:predicted enzyme related to lactoylglutathione lyase